MGDFLDMNNILTEDEAATLFVDVDDETQEPSKPDKSTEENNDNDDNEATEVTPDNLFDDDEGTPESVGSEEHTGNQEDTNSEKDGSSPDTNNFYSSIASALKEEGIFPDLDDSEIENIKEPEDFRDIVDKQIKSGLNEIQQRINDALNAGVEPSIIKQYENTLGFLNSITEEQLNDESDDGEKIRRQLLQQDFMNRGYSQERAVRMTEKLFASGEDIDEAKQALEGNREYFSSKYKEILANAKAEEEKAAKAAKKQAEDLKKDILSSEKVFGDISLDKSTRQKVYDTISRPVWKDPETGEYYTALQKYRRENENDFIKNVGLLFTLTNGFKDIDSLVKPQTKKEVRSKLRELEHTLNNTARNNNGTLKYVGNTGDKEQGSFFDNGFTIDIN